MFVSTLPISNDLVFKKELPNIQLLTDILTEIFGKRGQEQANSCKIRPPENEERIWLDPIYLMGLIKKKILEALVGVVGVEAELAK